jgi:hypothetical protein
VGAFTLAFHALTTPASAYFLHFDAPLQGYAAIALVRGCWEYATEKMVGVYLLAPLFQWLGPSPVWEIGVLAGLAAVTVALTYEMARLFSGSRPAGLLAALLLLALPSFGYFSRMHIGYVMPCLLLAWLAVWRQRWGWAGLGFGLVLIAHFGYAVVVLVSVVVLALMFLRPAGFLQPPHRSGRKEPWPRPGARADGSPAPRERAAVWSGPAQRAARGWRHGLAFGLAAALPILVVEAHFFAYMGRPWQWLKGVASAGYIWTGVRQGVTLHANWLWAPQTLIESNGVLLAALLGVGVLSPLVFWPSRRKLAFWLALAGSVAAFAFIALLRGAFIARALGPLYPLGAVCTAVVAAAAVKRLPAGWPRRVATAAALLGLAALVVNAGLFIREFSRTPFPAIGGWIRAAGAAGQPVKYNNQWVGLFFAQQHGTEMLTGDGRWIEADDTGQAVLIFERQAPANLTRTGYTIETADVNAAIDLRYPALARDADIPRHAEVWWPSGTAAPLRPEDPLPPSVYYYSGSGCVSPPAYAGGTQHFYQLAWRKLVDMLPG